MLETTTSHVNQPFDIEVSPEAAAVNSAITKLCYYHDELLRKQSTSSKNMGHLSSPDFVIARIVIRWLFLESKSLISSMR